jgi:hypothetical protein
MEEEVPLQVAPGILPDSRIEGGAIRKKKYQEMTK